MEKQAAAYFNSKDQYLQWRSLAPDVSLIISLPEKLINKTEVVDFLAHVDAEILDGTYLDYTKEKAESVHQSNRKIWADIQHPNENPIMWEKAIQLNNSRLAENLRPLWLV